MKLRYELTGTGWSDTTITIDERDTTVTASYLSDALADMLEATRSLLAGASEARFSFAEEPGEFRWILERAGSDVRVRILEFARLWGNQPDVEGKTVLETRLPITDFGRKVIQMAEDLRSRVGEDEYEKKWGEHPFPREVLQRLRTAFDRLKSED